MSSLTSHVLRIPRVDDAPDSFVLINFEKEDNAALDLRLTGTDGSSPFVGTIRESGIGKLQGKKPQCTSEEWEILLKAVLLHDPDALRSETCNNVEVVATVDNSVNVIVRRKIGDITSRLGSVQLQQDDDVEIGLFDWAAQAALQSDGLRSQLASLQASVARQQERVASLNAQLDDLVQAKKEHEDQLIAKFAELLNAKKLKIRDQQRLLAHASVDLTSAKQTNIARPSGRANSANRAVGPSRASKRKAGRSQELESESDVDIPDHQQVEDDDIETSEGFNKDATDDEDSDADGFAPAPPASQASRSGIGIKGKVLQPSKPQQDKTVVKESDAVIPPKRALPFAKKTTEKPTSPTKSRDPASPQGAKAVEDDEETDDEL